MKMIKTITVGICFSVLALSTSFSLAFAQNNENPSGVTHNQVKPIIFEGQSYSPQQAATFTQVASQVNHTVVEANGRVFGYEHKADADKHIDRILAAQNNEVVPEEGDYHATFWDFYKYTGASFDVSLAQNKPYVGDFWNNEISSIKTAYKGSGVTLYENINFTGSSIFFAPGAVSENLGWFILRPNVTWDDQTTSIEVKP
ncbi:peptidase inhibitor family I36 protein [Paenibacillus sp. 481]|uniref:peptidase inhibitor family I36 protein n=1 Tax=Paenibacillus sp. 481 TaxID=2835869 RepID=UPI001E386D7B|nr:peptidase inhibitor family I36 protein [Paenibacillus sp. 481]UHA71902.1 peptidase inhibitor family I36 protein [Paenibacillus sp. 481]